MPVATQLIYKLPNIYEPDNEDYTITCLLGPAIVFAAFEYPYLRFEPGIRNNGSYLITMTLKDTNNNPK